MKDSIYAVPLDPVAEFVFDDKVVSVFPDMINRSVPAYQHVVAMTGVLAGYFAQADSYLYDLGCSLGATSLAMFQNLRQPNCTLVAVDNSEAMMEGYRLILQTAMQKQHPTPLKIELICANIQDQSIEKASVVAMNFTLQFIPPPERLALIQKIYNGLLPNGVLIISEKIAFGEAEKQHLFTEIHHHFKRTNGYSDLEIAQKRSAIENVMIPESIEVHLERFANAGFSRAEVWFQSLNFASFLAIK